MAATELNNSVLKNLSTLKFYARFESGAETTDSSGNGNTLSNIGTPTYTTGRFGQCVSLASASSQAFSITNVATLKPTGAFSVSAWIKTSTTSTIQLIFQNYSQNTNVAGYRLWVLNNDKAIFDSGKNTGTTDTVDYQSLQSTTSVTDGNWHFLVGTWDGANMRLYVDSKCEATEAWTSAPAFSAQAQVRLGCYCADGSTNTLFFNGQIDDLSFYNGTALSADQIKELYEGRILGEGWPQAGLVFGSHLNGNSTDFSGNNNHGTDTAITYSQANGKFGQGGGFNGSSSVVSITDAASLKPTSAFTASVWFNTSYNSADTNIFQSFSQNSNIAGFYIKLGGNSSQAQLVVGRNTGTTIGTDWNACTSTKTRNDGKWHHFVATFDSSNLRVYTDGNLDATTAFAYSLGYAATNYVRIGCLNQSGSNSAFFNGKLDELQFFNVAKSPQWVRQQYALGVGKHQ